MSIKVTRETQYENLPDILVPNEVAAYLGLNVDTVRDYIRKGKIRASHQGKYYRIRKEWVIDYLEDNAEY